MRPMPPSVLCVEVGNRNQTGYILSVLPPIVMVCVVVLTAEAKNAPTSTPSTVPDTSMFPATSSASAGVVVPTPTCPLAPLMNRLMSPVTPLSRKAMSLPSEVAMLRCGPAPSIALNIP